MPAALRDDVGVRVERAAWDKKWTGGTRRLLRNQRSAGLATRVGDVEQRAIHARRCSRFLRQYGHRGSSEGIIPARSEGLIAIPFLIDGAARHVRSFTGGADVPRLREHGQEPWFPPTPRPNALSDWSAPCRRCRCLHWVTIYLTQFWLRPDGRLQANLVRHGPDFEALDVERNSHVGNSYSHVWARLLHSVFM